MMRNAQSIVQFNASCRGAFHQSRDFHTANYSKLINQHNLISYTHMQSACWCAAVRLQRVGTAAVWICRAAEPLSHTNTHSALFPRVCITSEECFQGDLCVLTGLHKAQPDLRELPHTQTPCSHRSISGFELQSLLGSRRHTLAQTDTHKLTQTDGLHINNTWVKPLKSSSNTEHQLRGGAP